MRFSKSGPARSALVALAAASTLVAAGCSAGSLGSSSSERQRGRHDDHVSRRQRDTDGGEREGDDRRLPGGQPGHHRQDGHPPGWFGR